MIQSRDELGRIKPKYTEEQMRELADQYLLTRDAKRICSKAGVNVASFYYWMKKFGIETSCRKYQLNEDYFARINTRNKAYILGFIMADGSVSTPCKTHTRPCRLTIRISKKDRCVLEFIKKELQCDYKIIDYWPANETYGASEMSVLVINSTKLCDDLAKYGIVENKTGSERVPKNISSRLLPHYIRGYFDGDGYSYKREIAYKGKVYHGNTIGFVAKTRETVEDLKEVLVNALGLPKQFLKICQEHRVNENGIPRKGWYLRINAKTCVQKMVYFMYHTDGFSLRRKRIKLT